MVQTGARSRKQRIEDAIAHALRGRWDLAADTNRGLLDEDPRDIESANRLGKALTELGDYKEAADAYRRALAIDRANPIARKNLQRLELSGVAKSAKAAKIRPPKRAKRAPRAHSATASGRPPARVFSLIEESGKSAELGLVRLNRPAARRLSSGNHVELQPAETGGLAVATASGVVIGYLEPQAGSRLRRLMEGGNRYEALVREVSSNEVTVFVREVYRHPSLLDQPSFLSASPDRRRAAPRAYTRSSLLRDDHSDTEFDDDDSEPDLWDNDEDEGYEPAEDSDEDFDEDAEEELEEVEELVEEEEEEGPAVAIDLDEDEDEDVELDEDDDLEDAPDDEEDE